MKVGLLGPKHTEENNLSKTAGRPWRRDLSRDRPAETVREE